MFPAMRRGATPVADAAKDAAQLLKEIRKRLGAIHEPRRATPFCRGWASPPPIGAAALVAWAGGTHTAPGLGACRRSPSALPRHSPSSGSCSWPAYLRQTERFFDLTGAATYLCVAALALLAAAAARPSCAAHRRHDRHLGSAPGRVPIRPSAAGRLRPALCPHPARLRDSVDDVDAAGLVGHCRIRSGE